jgi:NADH-quinone oxidoreductase subunit M
MNQILVFLFWPLASAVVLFFMGRHSKAAQWANLVFNAVWCLLLVQLWQSHPVTGASDSFPISFSWNWLPFLKSRFSLGVDGLSLPLIALNVLLSTCLALYSIGKKSLGSGYLGLFSVLNCAAVGSLMAADAFAFYTFWEFMLIPMYILIGRWGSKNRVYASLKFFAFTMGGSLLMLLSIIGLAYAANVPSLGWHDIAATKLPFSGWGSLQGLIFLGFLVAFAVKIPIWPVHTWLPDAHTEAPTGASVILAGVLLKLGVYGIARWCVPLFPDAARAAAPVMMTLGCIGIVLGAFAAWWQSDIKRMIAYSSVSHLGFMVLGLFALREEALQGAMFQNLGHGLSTGALFLIFGIIYDRTHTRALSEYGGLADQNGRLALLFVFATMASIGLPGLPGFVGEFLILTGTFMTSPVFALIGMSGVLLGAIYMLVLVRKLVWGPKGSTFANGQHAINLTWTEWAAVVPLAIAMLVLGLQPQFLIARAAPSITTILSGLR